jgi:hypothetical protein
MLPLPIERFGFTSQILLPFIQLMLPQVKEATTLLDLLSIVGKRRDLEVN